MIRRSASLATLFPAAILLAAPPQVPGQPKGDLPANKWVDFTAKSNKNAFHFSVPGCGRVVVSIVQQPYKKRSDNPSEHGSWWGSGDKTSFLAMVRMDVSVNGEDFAVPFDAIDYLADVNEIKVFQDSGNLIVELGGAQTGNAFDVRYTFQKKVLVERLVSSSELPEFWQKTTYHDTDESEQD